MSSNNEHESSKYPSIIVTVDVALFTLKDGQLHVVLQVRDKAPFEGMPALIGGFFHADEDADELAAANRTLMAKSGLVAPYLEQLYTFAGPDRDPRGYSVNVVHFALVNEHVLARQNLEKVMLVPVDDLPELAFTHNSIVDFAVSRIRGKSGYSTLPTYLLPELFTYSQLQATYEGVTGKVEDQASFRRKIKALNFLEETDKEFRGGAQRPAKLYRIREDSGLSFFKRTI
jgi:8-oxo-dGTP diphosphatase